MQFSNFRFRKGFISYQKIFKRTENVISSSCMHFCCKFQPNLPSSLSKVHLYWLTARSSLKSKQFVLDLGYFWGQKYCNCQVQWECTGGALVRDKPLRLNRQVKPSTLLVLTSKLAWLIIWCLKSKLTKRLDLFYFGVYMIQKISVI